MCIKGGKGNKISDVSNENEHGKWWRRMLIRDSFSFSENAWIICKTWRCVCECVCEKNWVKVTQNAWNLTGLLLRHLP